MNPVLIAIIIAAGAAAGIVAYFAYVYFRDRNKLKCPACGSKKTYLLKCVQYCQICGKNVGGAACGACKVNFLVCGHKFGKQK